MQPTATNAAKKALFMISSPVKQFPAFALVKLAPLSSAMLPPAIQPSEPAVISRYERSLPTLDGSAKSD
jgi:hypothetical protein